VRRAGAYRVGQTRRPHLLLELVRRAVRISVDRFYLQKCESGSLIDHLRTLRFTKDRCNVNDHADVAAESVVELRRVCRLHGPRIGAINGLCVYMALCHLLIDKSPSIVAHGPDPRMGAGTIPTLTIPTSVIIVGMGGGTGGYRGYMYPPPFLEGGYKRVHSVKVCVYPVVR